MQKRYSQDYWRNFIIDWIVKGITELIFLGVNTTIAIYENVHILKECEFQGMCLAMKFHDVQNLLSKSSPKSVCGVQKKIFLMADLGGYMFLRNSFLSLTFFKIKLGLKDYNVGRTNDFKVALKYQIRQNLVCVLFQHFKG